MTKLTGGRKLNREIADITPLEEWANTTDTKLIKEYREAPDKHEWDYIDSAHKLWLLDLVE